MSGKIPSDRPTSSQGSQQKEELQLTITPPQAERSAIPPSSSQTKINAEEMASSVKDHRKRERKMIEEEEEEELETPQQVEKKRELEPKSKEKIDALLLKVSECFESAPINANDLESIADFCFDKIKERIYSPKYLKTEEIIKIYQLLFETDLKPICEQILTQSLDPIAPHPFYVFNSLYECIKTLEAYPTFAEAEKAGEHYVKEKGLEAFFQQDFETRERILPHILSGKPDFKNIINNCPIYTTKMILGSQNIHSAFVLRDSHHQSKWIFKPTCSVYQDQLFELNPDTPYAHSIREQTACLLNHHSQFPVPMTLLIEIKGSVGSIQLFIEGKKRRLIQASPSEMPKLELQKLLIFDLLFSNCDRHDDNILLIESTQMLKAYGIDHDACFCFDNRPLKIDYLILASSFNCPFDKSIEHLISEENIEKYRRVMKDQEIDPKAIEWMDYAAQILKNAFNDNLNADLVAKNLMAKFKQRYVK